MGLALAIAEVAVRLFWSNAPDSVAAADSLPLEQIRDRDILYRLIPGASGQFNGTRIRVNSMGLRDRDYAIPAPPGTRRILVLGDSMVFGVGVSPEETLPGQLASLLAPVEAINAGLFGYNLTQEISLLRDVGLQYRPDVVVSCFVHNDIENWGLGDGGAVPEIKSSRFDPPPRGAWSTRLADLMLPGTFDPDRLNLLPDPAGRPGVRQRLASISRLYLFAYLRMRTHSWNLTGGERRDPLIDSPACRTTEVIWDPLREKYRRMKGMVERAGARLVVVIQGGLLWEGRPLARLRRLLAEEGIPCLDLTPVWGDAEDYARDYSLGWDPHPNPRAHALAAGLVGDYLKRAGLLPGSDGGPVQPPPGPHEVIAARADLRERLPQWELRESSRMRRDDTAWEQESSGFSSEVAFEGIEVKAAARAQILYGFWAPGEGNPPPGGGVPSPGDGWWMSSSAAVLLKPPAGARRLILDLLLPAEGPARGQMPSSLRLTFGAPPDRCRLDRVDLPIDPRTVGRAVRFELDLPGSLAGARTAEIDMSVDQPFLATYLNPGTRDARLVSFMLKRIALE